MHLRRARQAHDRRGPPPPIAVYLPWRCALSRLRWLWIVVSALGLELFWLGTFEYLRERPWWVGLILLGGPWLVALGAWLSQLPAGRVLRGALVLGASMLAVDLLCQALVALHTPLIGTVLQPMRLAALLPAAWLAPRLRGARGWRRWPARLVSGLVGVLALGYVAGAGYCLCWSGARLEPGREADAAVVLGFALRRGGEPTPSFIARLRHGARLYRQGRVRRLILTGGRGRFGPAESVVAARVVRELGVPARAVLREAVSRNTRNNLIEAARLARRHDLRTVLIVTEPFHMGRALVYAGTAGLAAHPAPSPSPIWDDPPRAANRVLQEAFYLVVAACWWGKTAIAG